MADSADARLVGYAARVAEALKPLAAADFGYGEFYISDVRFGYEGDDAGVRVVANEHGEFDVQVGDEA